MRFPNSVIGRPVVLLASILMVGSAVAADVTPEDPALAMVFPTMRPSLPAPGAPPDRVATGATTSAGRVAGMGPAIGTDMLDALRGGDVDNNVTIDGNVSGNSADRVVSGSNTIQDGAFANATGISTVIQNSGSNVLIQNGMVVNVQFTEPGL